MIIQNGDSNGKNLPILQVKSKFKLKVNSVLKGIDCKT